MPETKEYLRLGNVYLELRVDLDTPDSDTGTIVDIRPARMINSTLEQKRQEFLARVRSNGRQENQEAPDAPNSSQG